MLTQILYMNVNHMFLLYLCHSLHNYILDNSYIFYSTLPLCQLIYCFMWYRVDNDKSWMHVQGLKGRLIEMVLNTFLILLSRTLTLVLGIKRGVLVWIVKITLIMTERQYVFISFEWLQSMNILCEEQSLDIGEMGWWVIWWRSSSIRRDGFFGTWCDKCSAGGAFEWWGWRGWRLF